MSLSDIIIKIFEEHGSLSSREVLEIIKQNQKTYGIQRIPSLRTIQRHIQKYVEEGVLKPEPPIGREQKYSLTTKEERKKQLQTYLIKRFWNHLEAIEQLYLQRDIFGAYKAADLLIRRLPNPHKQKLKKLIENIEETSKKALEKDNPYIRIIHKYNLLANLMPTIIEAISDTLHEMQEETNHD